jgi:hypothetical protein
VLVQHFSNGVLFVPAENTKSKKDFSVYLSEAGTQFFSHMIAGKRPNDYILVKATLP